MLKTTLMNDLKDAMKQRNHVKKSVITMLRGALLNEEKSLKRELTPQEEITVVRREIKQAEQTLASATHAYREDVERKAKTEIHLLSKYLPVQMTEQEVMSYVSNLSIDESEMNMKALMGRLNSELGAKAEAKILSSVAKEIIALNKASQTEGETKETKEVEVKEAPKAKAKKTASKPKTKKVDKEA